MSDSMHQEDVEATAEAREPETQGEEADQGGFSVNPKLAGYVGGAVFYFIFKFWSPLGEPGSIGQAFLYGAIPAMIGYALFSGAAFMMNQSRNKH